MTLCLEWRVNRRTRQIEGCPIVVCDQCGRPIRDASRANYEWLQAVADARPLRRSEPVFFVHKRCTRAFRQARPAEPGETIWMWGELRHLPTFLERNLTAPGRRAA